MGGALRCSGTTTLICLVENSLRHYDRITRTASGTNPLKAADRNPSCCNLPTGTAFLRPNALSIRKAESMEDSICDTLSAIGLIVDFTQETVSVLPIWSRSDRVWAFQIPFRRLSNGHFLSLVAYCPLVDNRDLPISS